MKRRTISKLAREAGVGIETVRFYEKRGILKQPDAPAEGWREYGDEALETIRYIKIGQQMGFKLAEMQRLQQKARGEQRVFCESVREATRAKIKSVEEQIRQLQQVREDLTNFLDRCSAKKPTERCPIYQSLGAIKKK
ncbi:MAG TPA: MerR family transcriptional regulator [Candidatus Acidoferrum sp.]|nr:MerR family transcriptional regulator [Candidatus Acidoferrum sp.]